jgi:predicted nucleic acid-binding protein
VPIFRHPMCALAIPHKIYFLWRPYLRDRKDELVLELAVTARCDYIITYNQRDFRGAEMFGIRIRDPRAFLQAIGELP